MLKPIVEAAVSASTCALLFTAGWAWYYVTVGWRWYLQALNGHRQRQFFTWRFRMTALMIFTIVYFSVLQKLSHR